VNPELPRSGKQERTLDHSTGPPWIGKLEPVGSNLQVRRTPVKMPTGMNAQVPPGGGLGEAEACCRGPQSPRSRRAVSFEGRRQDFTHFFERRASACPVPCPGKSACRTSFSRGADPSPARAYRSRHSLGSSSRLETVFPLRPTAVSGGSPAYGWSGLRAYRYFCFCPSRRESRPSGRAMFYSGSFCSPSMVSSAEACAARVPGCPPPRLMV
jgi:hypothetical protein